MSGEGPGWCFALAPDVALVRDGGAARLRTDTASHPVEGKAEHLLLEALAGEGCTAAALAQVQAQAGPGAMPWEALLYRLERAGLLRRCLTARGRPLASLVPQRPPPVPLDDADLPAILRLSPKAVAGAEDGAIVIERPGGWARLVFHDPSLLPLLGVLAAGQDAPGVMAALPCHAPEAVLALLALLDRCGLLDRGADDGWPLHELIFHTRTRRGYGRRLLGKAGGAAAPAPPAPEDGAAAIHLVLPDAARLEASDPPFARVAARRRSLRQHGACPLGLDQLSEFLFRTLHAREGRRPYPSGGACYPLRAYLAAGRCEGLARGLYLYAPERHVLLPRPVSRPDRLDVLLAEAASTAGIAAPPQLLLVLAAEMERIRPAYGDLGYSLVLKEVGAVFQAAMLAAAAMGLASCPLGCGDALAFAGLLGVDPAVEAPVGELMLGTAEDAA